HLYLDERPLPLRQVTLLLVLHVPSSCVASYHAAWDTEKRTLPTCLNGQCLVPAGSTGGTSGGGCSACTASQVCSNGRCVPNGSSGGSSGGCTPSCGGKCGGAPDGCNGTCPAAACTGCCDANKICQAGTANGDCGKNGAACTTCNAPDVCAAGTCAASCTPQCGSGKCVGGSDGCGGTCATGSCNGCCDGNKNCQPGNTQAACGIDGNACGSCSNGPCQSGVCCTKTAQPACSLTPSADGCGGTYAANCTTACCGSACCAAGQVCTAGGVCCSPDCSGKCPYASDGCGGTCPVPAGGNPGCSYNGAAGCCDSNGVCQPGSASTACGTSGACQDCSVNSTTCNRQGGDGGGYLCCTPGAGCGYSCGSAKIVDSCGVVCPANCPYNGCCGYSNGVCYTPGNLQSQCAYGGTNSVCMDCGTSACVDPTAAAQGNYNAVCGTCPEGNTQVASCNGNCGQVTQLCQGGQWVNQGSCTNICGGSACCDVNGNCQPGSTTTACLDGNGNGTCTDCTKWASNQWATGEDQGYGTCQNQNCCLTKGAPLATGASAFSCCSGAVSCDIFGNNCSCT
ncbi:MAG: hypothetical protein ACYDCL_15470, partial [Myxococcales bacterium]